VVSGAMACPYAGAENSQSRHFRRLGVLRMLDWLEAQPGSSWRDRWHAGCRAAAGQDWRDVAERWLKDAGRIADGNRAVWQGLGGALGLLIGRDVIRPDLGWLLASATPAHLAADMARVRDPAGFAALEEVAGPASVSVSSTRRAMLQVAVIMAVKGGMAGDVTVGDCLELLEARARARGDSDNGGTYFYQLLHAAGFLPAGAPPRAGMLNPRVRGQLSAGQLIDRYDLACRPVRDLLADYLNERRPGIDYVTMNGLAYQLGLLFWKDLETHHPGIGSLNLAPDVAVAWKQRMQSRTVETTGPGGERTQARVPRLSVVDHLTIVRSFYLDIAEWAATDPSRWAQWAVPCPVRPGDLTHRQALRRRKSRTDQRTRERLPVLPRLIAAAERELAGAASRLAAAAAAAPGQEFTAGGQTLARATLKDPSPRIWAEDRDTGKRRNLTEEEEHAFWGWASIELLRHSGIRIEELAELSHHSLVRYQLPGAELIPLLHITPSKTDIERMLVISPELSEVLAVVIARVRGQGTGAVPLVTAYDPLERVWNPPSPLLLQRRAGAEDRPFSRHYMKRRIEDTAMAAGLTASTGGPLTFTPHDMRRIFTTEALQNGLPPHICQLILGHYAGDPCQVDHGWFRYRRAAAAGERLSSWPISAQVWPWSRAA
jgi:integrase